MLGLKKIIFNFSFNICLFILLIIGIQNSSEEREVNLLTLKSINLPVSFILGMSFISGSFAGGIVSLNLEKNKK